MPKISSRNQQIKKGLIRNNPVFLNKSKNLQRPVWQQLAIALERLGCNGNGASVGRFARQWGLGISTVVKYTKHIITAINSIGNNYVQWPNSLEKQQISDRIEQSSGFKGCIGYLDGTDVVLEYKPSEDGEIYYNRKKRYALTVQLVCDDLKYIRFANFGWLGSVTDSTAYKSTPLFNEVNKFFSQNEYLLADCGYQLTSTTITPYKQPQASISKNTFFNEMLAKERVKIEHVNGIWKGRFECLNRIRT
ncbi:17831_t:CDS:2 [Cetraspora pellucida]|uniref:17831_t:CDS:1 n=1 Tax=Cetraspora pellucida TaxID=1433469 RepID=A0A9N9GJJ3_9GLOM|nr:17831_t:CDS:2 [Cetraspora pellucida]